MTKRTIEKQYDKYSLQFKELRKSGLVKEHQRKLTKKQFTELANIHHSASKARKEALAYQNKVGELTEGQINKIWKTYKKQGGVESMTGKYDAELSEQVTRKFRKKETMLKNLKANQLIQLMVDSGISRIEALENYGY